MSPKWKQKDKPGSLEAKFIFDSYDILREFLDDVADVAETVGHHPNLSFGREHVSVIIYAQGESLGDIEFALAKGIDEAFAKVSKDTDE